MADSTEDLRREMEEFERNEEKTDAAPEAVGVGGVPEVEVPRTRQGMPPWLLWMVVVDVIIVAIIVIVLVVI